jgi:allophanate hydrolase subunit 1
LIAPSLDRHCYHLQITIQDFIEMQIMKLFSLLAIGFAAGAAAAALPNDGS